MNDKQQDPQIDDRDQSKYRKNGKLKRTYFDDQIKPLQVQLNAMHRWLQRENKRLVILFEGRDAAGKGGAINIFTSVLNPRYCKIAALAKPTERERGQWYFQRYVSHLPATGEITLFDRSWYNRAGVEKVMGFCSDEEHKKFLDSCPAFEQMLVEDGVILLKYWFAVDQKEQEKRFLDRIKDPVKRWKLSPVDMAARERFDDYTRAREVMFEHTHTPSAPWHLVDCNDQRQGRLNMVADALHRIPWVDQEMEKVDYKPLCKKELSLERTSSHVEFVEERY